MQKVIRHAERATKYAAKKKVRVEKSKLRAEEWDRNQTKLRIDRDIHQRTREARINRVTDWQAGALAPRRDVGELANTYGAASIYNIQMPELNPKDRPQWLHIREGDRVVILKGPDKGRIGTVNEVSKEKGGVTVKDLNLIDVHIPKWMKDQNGEKRDTFSIPQMMPLAHVKLVFPLPDPETGIHRDVIIERLEQVHDPTASKDTPKDQRIKRAIPGTNTIIPWPFAAEPEEEDHEDDTLRISVEEQTFRPTLIRAPMPFSVIDELRSKYSKYRTRHDYEYRMMKEAEDEKIEGRKDLIKTMRTPRQELAELRAMQKAAEERELTREQLARIGEVIAQEQARTTKFVKALQQDEEQVQIQ